ncbi:MAG: sigma-54 dependent transcriptional regulator [Caldimonas sp.]
MSAVLPCEPLAASTVQRVLIVDDDHGVGNSIQMLLGQRGVESVVCRDATAATLSLEAQDFDLVVTDLRLPDGSGLDILAAIRAAHPDVQVILMTSFSSMESAIEALRRGANAYIIKPFDNDDFMFSVRRSLDERRTRRENVALKRTLRHAFAQNEIVGESPCMQRLRSMIERLSHTEANVLIQGESGTGKELVAQGIHFSGSRSNGPFVPVNCGAIPSDLIESELFGHVRGAFTGAVGASDGLIREASGGTLFLDEISEMPLNVQVKLLRVIQERQVRPLGSTHSYRTDTRFLAASNRNLKESAEKGTFRADLFYRLNVITVNVPPLRDRGDDIELLARQFMLQSSRKMGNRVRGMRADFVESLRRYSWPGNVRELQNVIERAVILAESDALTMAELEDMIALPHSDALVLKVEGAPLSIEEYIRETILRYQDSHSETALAAMLGIGRKALWMRRRNWALYRDGERGGGTVDASKPSKTMSS